MEPTTPGLTWRKSSRSLTSYDWQCIELARLPDGGLAVRDSKDPNSPILRLPRAAGQAFISYAAVAELKP